MQVPSEVKPEVDEDDPKSVEIATRSVLAAIPREPVFTMTAKVKSVSVDEMRARRKAGINRERLL